MKTFEKLIRQHIQARKILLILIVTSTVYLAMVLITIPMVIPYESKMPLLDMMPMGYDMEYVTNLFDDLETKGRKAYLYQQIPLDIIYPSLFAICYCLILGFFLNKLNKLKTPFLYLCLLPFMIAIMDYAENIGIISMLKNYPKILTSTVTITSVFTLLKSMGTTIYFVVLIGILIILGIKTLKKEKDGTA